MFNFSSTVQTSTSVGVNIALLLSLNKPAPSDKGINPYPTKHWEHVPSPTQVGY